MKTYDNPITVDEDNIAELQETYVPGDQRKDLEPGCKTWRFQHAKGFTGSATTWPNGRGAICLGGDSVWGDVEGYILTDDEGVRYDLRDGEEL